MRLSSLLLLVQFVLSFPLFSQNDPSFFTPFNQSEVKKDYEKEDNIISKLNFDPLSLPATFTKELNLLHGISFSADFERLSRKHPLGDVDVYYGNTGDPRWAHLPHYRDLILTVNRNSGKIILHALTSDGIFSAFPTTDGEYRITEEAENTCEVGDNDIKSNGIFEMQKNVTSVAGCGEQDENGNYVVDMFFGFTHEANSLIGDVIAYSIAQAETVNLGLQNSQVPDLYLRAVNYAVRDFHIGVKGSSPYKFWVEFSAEHTAAAADFAAFYDTAFPGANNGGGYAVVPGRYSISYAGTTGIFRHEWGHNSGSNHCSGGFRPYAAGYNNGNTTTHLCGNGSNFFSNPDIVDGAGLPLGSPTADNARNLTERRNVISAFATHITPIGPNDTGEACAQDIPNGHYAIQNAESLNYLSPIGSGHDGDKIDQEADLTENEYWDIIFLGNGAYNIQHFNTGRSLEVLNNTTNIGAEVAIKNTNTYQRQNWLIEPAGNGNYRIKSAVHFMCIQTPDGATADEDIVIQDACEASLDEEWILTLVTPASGDPIINLTSSSTSVSCPNAEDGVVSIAAIGGNGTYSYQWDNGQNTSTITDLSVGNYRVTVTSGGKKAYHRVRVGGKVQLLSEIIINDAVQSTGVGSIDITNVQNAVAPITYNWSDGATGSSRTNLAIGEYTVTVTDANGCIDVRIMKIFEALDDQTEYIIQHVASGLYVQPLDGGTGNGTQMVLGNCPTDDMGYRWRAERSHSSLFRFRNMKSEKYIAPGGQNNGANTFHLSSSSSFYILTRTSPDTYTLFNNGNSSKVNAANNNLGSFLTQTSSNGDEFRFIPIPVCTPDPSGTICDDGDNTTLDDEINLLCQCCGIPTECFGIGNTDNDGECADVDCDDNDATIFTGAPCDDNNSTTISDFIQINCACLGRSTTCAETGNDLDNVALWGSTDARYHHAATPTADILIDERIDTYWRAGGAWGWMDVTLLQQEMIKEIIIYPRQDCCNYLLNNIKVACSDIPFTGNGIPTNGDFYYEIPADYNSFDPITIPVGIMGRYVRLKASGQTMMLAEIEVKTCPVNAAPLPVELLNFSGEVLTNTNRLHWSTTKEINNAGFEIQRSDNSRDFISIDFVEGAENSEELLNYRFDDNDISDNQIYYRLRQLDISGTEKLSPIISLNRTPKTAWQIFPNPISNSRMLNINQKSGINTEFELISLNGDILENFSLNQRILYLKNLSAGVYLLRNKFDGMVKRVVIL